VRLLYLCADPGISILGDKGASVHLNSLARALSRAGHQVTVACRRVDGPNSPPEGVRISVLPGSPGEQRDWLLELLRHERMDALLERYSLASGPGLDAARRFDLPFLLELNAPLVDESVRFRGLADPEPLRTQERRLLRSADGVFVVSEALRGYAVASGADPERVRVVPNGVDHQAFARPVDDSVRQRLGLTGQVVVGFVGSLKPWHGVSDLIRAFASLPPSISLLVVGDGPERSAIEAAVEAAMISDRVRLIGRVPHVNVPAYLQAMDIGVAPYRRQPMFYFSPLKVVEYLAAGLPVVATSQGELAELIGPAGLVVAPDSVAALAAALRRLVTNPTLRTSMSGCARARVADRGWDRVVKQIEAAPALYRVSA
jgi:glycosyltransferase involved in cell wall biosynthesis